MAEMGQPVLVVVGEDDHADIHDIAMRLVAELPEARYELIPRAAHVVPLERPAEFNAVLAEFLERNGL